MSFLFRNLCIYVLISIYVSIYLFRILTYLYCIRIYLSFSSWLSSGILDWRFSQSGFGSSFENLACLAAQRSSDRTKRSVCRWLYIYIYIYIYMYIYIFYLYIYNLYVGMFLFHQNLFIYFSASLSYFVCRRIFIVSESIYLSIYLSLFISIYLSIYPSTTECLYDLLSVYKTPSSFPVNICLLFYLTDRKS